MRPSGHPREKSWMRSSVHAENVLLCHARSEGMGDQMQNGVLRVGVRRLVPAFEGDFGWCVSCVRGA